MRWHTLLPAALVSCLLLTAAAHADPRKPTPAEIQRAHELFQQSKPLQDAKKYEEAAKLLAEAWSLQHSPDIATNLAMSEGMLGRYRDAAEHLSFASRNMPASADAAQRERIAEAYAKAKSEVVEIVLTVDPERAEISVDGQRVGMAPLDGPLYVDPGKRTITATATGYQPRTEVVTAKKGESRSIALVLEREASAPTPGAPTPGDGRTDATPTSKSWVPVYVAGGVALAGVGGALYFGLTRSSAEDDADELSGKVDPKGCGAGTTTPSECAELQDKNQSAHTAGDLFTVSLITTGTAVVFGVGYLLWPTSKSEASRSKSVRGLSNVRATPVLAPSRAGLFVSGSF